MCLTCADIEKERIEVEIALDRIQREQEELEKLQALEDAEQQQSKLTMANLHAEENKDIPSGMLISAVITINLQLLLRPSKRNELAIEAYAHYMCRNTSPSTTRNGTSESSSQFTA